ncbi:MAG: exonuclease subunit SbcD, partial [Bacteroidota bacterium]|nr:exonuclease subunit SbcD [Bacteroidota bacterium]
PEQKEVLNEICEIAEREGVHAVLIAGDLFDTFNPSAEAQDLFYKTLRRLGNNGKRAVIAIAGNHDQPDRIEAPDHLARECGIIFIGYPNSRVSACNNEGGLCISKSEEGFIELKLQQCRVPLRIIATPYANEFRLKTYLGAEDAEEELRMALQKNWQQLADKYCDDKGINILCTHLYFQKKGELAVEEPDDEKPILHVGGAQAIYSSNIPHQIQYVALGHLHKYQVVDMIPCPVVYSSSPLAYSFAEADQEKYVVILDAEVEAKLSFQKVRLTRGKRLLRQRFESMDDALLWLHANQQALVEITMVTEDFLSVTDRKALNEVHGGIVNIIPEVKNRAFVLNQKGAIDLNKSIEQLFVDYFQHNKGQHPDAATMDLFKEVLGTEE